MILRFYFIDFKNWNVLADYDVTDDEDMTLFCQLFIIVIIFYSPSCLGQETAKGPFRSSSQAATCPPVGYTRWRLHTVPLIAESQAGKL